MERYSRPAFLLSLNFRHSCCQSVLAARIQNHTEGTISDQASKGLDDENAWSGCPCCLPDIYTVPENRDHWRFSQIAKPLFPSGASAREKRQNSRSIHVTLCSCSSLETNGSVKHRESLLIPRHPAENM